jgi:hypothetical protein
VRAAKADAVRGGHAGAGGGGGGGTSYQPYISTSAINQPIPVNPPIHPDSALMISSANNWLNGSASTQAEWLGGGNRVNYYRGDTSGLTKVTVYINNSSSGFACGGGGTMLVPMPSWMAGVMGPRSQSGDSNLNIVDSVTGDVWELWRLTPPGYASRNITCDSSRWNCLTAIHWPGDTLVGDGYSINFGTFRGTSGSKIHLTAGLLVPEDFADCFSGTDPGTVIPHALRMDTFCGSNGTVHPKFVLPAFNGDGAQGNGIPAGARVQLDPSIDVSTVTSVNAKPEPWRSALKKILRTLQVYGIIQVDSMAGPGGDIDAGTSWTITQGTYNGQTGWDWPWDVAGLPWSANPAHSNGVPYDLMDNFRVIDWTQWTGA